MVLNVSPLCYLAFIGFTTGMALKVASSTLVADIQRRLVTSATSKNKEWFENYVKNSRWRGNKTPMVREAVLSAVKETPVAVEVRYGATMQLLKSEFSDDKLAGMILFQEKTLPDPAARALLYPTGGLGPVLDDVGELFADESLTGVCEWSSCDWLCMKVLGPWVAGHPRPRDAARELMSWSRRDATKTSVWERRAGHVAFISYIRDKSRDKAAGVKRKRPAAGEAKPAKPPTGGDELFGDGFLLELIGACDAALADPQRFAQTGCGWVLRYCLLERRAATVEVLTRRAPGMTTEGMRYALEKCPDAALSRRLLKLVGGGSTMPK